MPLPSFSPSATGWKSITATCRTWSSPSSRQAVDAADPVGKRTAKAALKIAVDMAGEGLISREEAVMRIDPASLDQLLHPTIDPQCGPRHHRLGPSGVAGCGHGRDRVHLRGSR
jgi:hypothetical protein